MEPIEVEVKIPVSGFEDVRERLLQQGFVTGMVHEETDTYFNSDDYDLKAQDKALRIRRIVDLENGKKWAQINCKGPKLDGISLSRMEIETSVEDPDAIESILGQLGFHPVRCIVRKTRYYFSRGNITASIDQVEGLGDFLELEIVEREEGKREGCLLDIQNVMTQLGFNMENTVRTSYLSLLQKKYTEISERTPKEYE